MKQDIFPLNFIVKKPLFRCLNISVCNTQKAPYLFAREKSLFKKRIEYIYAQKGDKNPKYQLQHIKIDKKISRHDIFNCHQQWIGSIFYHKSHHYCEVIDNQHKLRYKLWLESTSRVSKFLVFLSVFLPILSNILHHFFIFETIKIANSHGITAFTLQRRFTWRFNQKYHLEKIPYVYSKQDDELIFISAIMMLYFSHR